MWVAHVEHAKLQRELEKSTVLIGALTADREHLEKHGSLPPPVLPSGARPPA